MKRNGVLLTLLTVISLPLFLYQNLTANVGCVERGETQQSNPKSETCGEQSRTIQNPKLDTKEFAQKTMKLHMPFIANNGQMDGQVKFYAKTFGGTVFVTKEGEIVYALPANSSECRGKLHSPNHVGWVKGNVPNKENIKDGFATLNPSYFFDANRVSDIVHPASWIVDHDKSVFQNLKSAIKNDAVCHPECNEGSLVLKRDSSPLAQNDKEAPEIRNPKHVASGVEPSETCGEQSRTIQNPKSGIALREEFVGAKVKVIQGEEPSVTKVSYFKGNDASKWKTNISTYDAVNLGEIYDGIELKLRAYGNNVEKLFYVKPGAGTERIRLRLSGGKDFNINNKGELEVETELGLVIFTKPIAYQEVSGKRVEVECKYTIADCGMGNVEITHPLVPSREGINPKSKTCGERSRTIQNPKFEYGFAVASYDRTKPLIIDPLLASTYLGGIYDDYNFSFTVVSGNVYVTGFTDSTDFPTTSEAYDTSFNGGDYDVFISKLDSGLTSLFASTYLGGIYNDYSYSLALDTSGNVYVTGNTSSSDFPTTSGAYDTSKNGNYDVFVSKLDGGLTTLMASTYLGGSSSEEHGYSLTLDTSGNVYVTGYTYSQDFPTTSGAYDTSNYGAEVFISKLDSGLTTLMASTYLGARIGYSLALDTSGNVYVTGVADSPIFPTTSGAYDTSYNSGYGDVFISKLDGGLTSLMASTYLGGSGFDKGYSLAINTSEDVYLTGYTKSSDFPTTSGAYDTSHNGSLEVFVSKLDSELTSLLASTYLGGSEWEEGYSLALDTNGNVYVTGYTQSPDFPTTIGAYSDVDTSIHFGQFVFISKLDDGLGTLTASALLGGATKYGSDNNTGKCITLDTNGNVYVTGHTYSSNFPTTSGAYDTSKNGNYDVFVSKLDGNLSAPCKADNIDADPGDIVVQTGDSADETITITCADAVTPVSGETVKAKVKSGNDKVTVSPRSAVTDENGQAVFTIQGIKAGRARVEFKDVSAELKVKVNVTVTQ